MSFQAMAWAVQQKPAGWKEKFVLLLLANYASSEDGRCFPSIVRLSDETMLSKSSVLRAIASLEATGFITVERRTTEGVSLPNHYVLNLKGVVSQGGGGGVTQNGGVVSEGHPNLSPEPINKPIKEEDLIFAELSKVLSEGVAKEVIQYRKGMKAKLTPYAAELLAKKFKLWPNPDEAANHMIVSGWRGFEVSWMEKAKPSKPVSTQFADKHGNLPGDPYYGVDY